MASEYYETEMIRDQRKFDLDQRGYRPIAFTSNSGVIGHSAPTLPGPGPWYAVRYNVRDGLPA